MVCTVSFTPSSRRSARGIEVSESTASRAVGIESREQILGCQWFLVHSSTGSLDRCYTYGGMGVGGSAFSRLLAQRLLALGQVLLVEHRRELLAKLLLEGLRRVRQTLGLELGLALVLGRGLLVADVEVLLDRLAALERLLEAAEGVGAPA